MDADCCISSVYVTSENEAVFLILEHFSLREIKQKKDAKNPREIVAFKPALSNEICWGIQLIRVMLFY